MSQSAFDDFNAGELSPGSNIESDEDILDWVGRDAETALHPSCTARMGVGSNSAICPLTMKPHGTEGLRVVDASSMPYITNGIIFGLLTQGFNLTAIFPLSEFLKEAHFFVYLLTDCSSKQAALFDDSKNLFEAS